MVGMTVPNAAGRPLERALAHYHRLLAELLTHLVEDGESGEAQVTWLDDRKEHLIHEDKANEYARAVYLLKDLGRHERVIQEMAVVEAEIAGLYEKLGEEKSPLVTPDVRLGLSHVRVQKVETFVSTSMTGAAARGGLTQTRNNLAKDLAFEQRAGVTGAAELLAELERALGALAEVENVRVRWPMTRYHAVLHPLDADAPSERVYVTKPGLIAVGPGITLSRADAPRRRRRDRVTIAPLAEYQGRLYFDLEEWEAARAAARKTD